MPLTVAELNQRSLEIFRELVDTYVETGEPVGSRTLSRRLKNPLSPATIRNIMADLEEAGLLYAPHTSAGRLPTEEGLRFFVHGLLEIGDLEEEERQHIDRIYQGKSQSATSVLEKATTILSGLSHCAGLVMAPKTDSPLKHIEFVPLNQNRALVILITEDGVVENRIIEIPKGITQFILNEATNYLNNKLAGKTLLQANIALEQEKQDQRSHLNELTSRVISEGLAVWAGDEDRGSLIVKGQSNLLHGVTEISELEQIKELLHALDTKQTLQQLLDASIKGEGIQIFIGAENNLFKLSGCSVIVSPYHISRREIIGALGVVGPARMNYGKIIPLVDYTAKLVGKLLG